MADPFVAEIRIFPFNFAPKGWAFCDGQLLPLSQNTALFSLLGTFYGGDGKSTFALPNMQTNAPMNIGQGSGLSERFLGESGGEQFVTLLQTEIPAHQHFVSVSTQDGNEPAPADQKFAKGIGVGYYAAPSNPAVQMNFQTLTVQGSSLPHNNMQPFLTLNFCIALQGVFPPRT
jgi:microcystin-dependent protein